MKSNVTMLSPDRELFGVIIKQQTKDKFVSVSDLQSAYDVARWQYGWNEKRIANILANQTTKERIYYLLLERGIIKTGFPEFTEMVEKEALIKVLKGLQVWKTTGRGESKSVYCDPYIWVLLAMELNPMLYAKVVVWITDTLVFDRIEAGTEYRPMNEAIKTVVSTPDYVKYAKLINISVFGKHETGMRNLASAKELKKISDLEKFIIQTIKMGFIKTEAQILTAIANFK